MATKNIKIFLASSYELKEDRDQFRIFISVENDRLRKQGIYLELVQWEHFLDTISTTRLQDEYNNALRECDWAVCLFFTKAGKYTTEEFKTAYKAFKETGKPLIWTYLKNAPILTGNVDDTILSLLEFKRELKKLEHFPTNYDNIDGLKYHFKTQLDRILPTIVKDLQHEQVDNPKTNRTISVIQNAEKIINIGKIDKADFS
jgi:hypothetical protein